MIRMVDGLVSGFEGILVVQSMVMDGRLAKRLVALMMEGVLARQGGRSEEICTSVACVWMGMMLLPVFAFSTAGEENS